MADPLYSIGALSRQTDCKIPTIRYYEEIGLLPAPARTPGNQRRYESSHLERLQFIRHARSLGFSLGDIEELIQLSGEPRQEHAAHDIAEKQLQEVKYKIEQLMRLKEELARMIAGCQQEHTERCRVIEVLSDHGLCRHEH